MKLNFSKLVLLFLSCAIIMPVTANKPAAPNQKQQTKSSKKDLIKKSILVLISSSVLAGLITWTNPFNAYSNLSAVKKELLNGNDSKSVSEHVDGQRKELNEKLLNASKFPPLPRLHALTELRQRKEDLKFDIQLDKENKLLVEEYRQVCNDLRTEEAAHRTRVDAESNASEARSQEREAIHKQQAALNSQHKKFLDARNSLFLYALSWLSLTAIFFTPLLVENNEDKKDDASQAKKSPQAA